MEQSNLAEYYFGEKTENKTSFPFFIEIWIAHSFSPNHASTPRDKKRCLKHKKRNFSNRVFQPFDTIHTARCVKHKNETFIKYYGSGFWHLTDAPSLFLCFDLLSYFPRLLASFQLVSCGTCMRPHQTKCPCMSPHRKKKPNRFTQSLSRNKMAIFLPTSL